MAKKIKITENTVITHDDKGKPSLVGKAKEALNSFHKMKIDVTILLDKTDKDTVEKLLRDNDVPYADIIQNNGDNEQHYDLCVVGGTNVVKLDDNWMWTAEEVVRRLYDGSANNTPRSEQQTFDKALADIKKYAQQRAKSISDNTIH